MLIGKLVTSLWAAGLAASVVLSVACSPSVWAQRPAAPPPPPPRPQAAADFDSFRPLVIDVPVAGVEVDTAAGRGRLTTADAMAGGLVLQAIPQSPVRMTTPAADPGQYWVMLPVEANVVRLQLVSGSSLWSLAATGPAGPAVLVESERDARQLWRIARHGAAMRLDSVAYPGRSLAGSADGLVQLERSSGGEAQRWLASFAAPPPALQLPEVRLTEHAMRPQEELAAARVELFNSYRSDLTVVIGDLRTGRPYRTLQIPAGGSVPVVLQRDAGGVIVESYVVQTLRGPIREEYVTSLPPAALYEISVYERFLQSIAIDRTGKSPHPIEDINYQSKSVGIFPVPAGDLLADGDRIDVWQWAQAHQNPGAVRPLRSQDERERLGPLERALQEFNVPPR